MKKSLLLIVALIVANIVRAQTIDSIPHHHTGHSTYPVNIMQMADGSILGGILLADIDNNYNTYRPVGYLMHKVSRHGLEFADTLLLPYPQRLPWCKVFKNRMSEDYLYVEMANHSPSCTFDLSIFRLDEQLDIDSTDAVRLVLEEGLMNGFEPGMLHDPQNDLVVAYYDANNNDSIAIRFTRIGIEGEIKHSRGYSQTELPISWRVMHWGPKIFSNSPLKYCVWGLEIDEEAGHDYLHCFVLDSLFNIEKQLTIHDNLGYPASQGYTMHGSWSENMLGFDNGDFMVGLNYSQFTQMENGVMLRKYDSSCLLLNEIKFPAEPYLQNQTDGSHFIGLEHSHDGCIYFAYYSQSPFGYGLNYFGQLVVVKMDEDLNVIWKRYCLEPIGYGRDYGCITVLNDNAVAVLGSNYNTGDLFYVIVNDDYDGLDEQNGITIRPYAFWPNPAKDILNLQYSPDVTPKKIELYDLQGRLVRSQTTALECINMERLSTGTYMMRITLEGGKVFSDKVVKE